MTQAGAGQMQILLVDDDDSFNELIREYLSTRPATSIDSVASGSEAWEKLQQTAYGLVVLDWKLPHISGLILFNRLRSLPAYSKTPVLISSGLLQKADFSLLEEYPCTQCLPKPYGVQALNDTVTRLIADSQWYATNEAAVGSLMAGVAQKERQALLNLQALLQSWPANILPLCLMAARHARQANDLKTAETLLRTQLKKYPDAVSVLYELAKVLFQDKRHEEALALLTAAQKLSPKNLGRAHMMGEVALNMAQAKVASDLFQQALDLDPGHEPAKRGREISLALQEQIDGSNKVTQSLASMINMMAIGLVHAGKYEQGTKRYQDAMEFIQDPLDRARLSFNLGLGLTRAGRPADAVAWYTEADRIAGGKLAKARKALGQPVLEEQSESEIEIEGEETFAAPPVANKPEPVIAAAPAPSAPSTAASTAAEDTAEASPVAKAAPQATRSALQPPAVETLQLPAKPLAVSTTLAWIKKSLAEQVKREAVISKNTSLVGKASLLLFHDEDNGWVRAEKQLQSLDASWVKGFTRIQPLLDTLRCTPQPLLIVWLGNDPKGAAFELLEALHETDLNERVGILVQCVGEKVMLDARVQKAEVLLQDRIQIINWTRAKFEEQVAGAIASLQAQDSMLSQLHKLKQNAAKLNTGEPPPAELATALKEAKQMINIPEVNVWFDLQEVGWLARAGRIAEARSRGQQLLKRTPELFVVRLALAALDAQEGQPNAALELLEWLNKTSQSTHERQTLIISTLADHGLNEAARKALRAAAASTEFAASYRYTYLAARLLLSEGDADRAAVCCDQAIAMQPLRWELLELYGDCLRALNDGANAVQVLDAALQCVGANQQRILLLKSRCLTLAGKWPEAEACVQRVLDITPTYAEALALKAAIGRRKVA